MKGPVSDTLVSLTTEVSTSVSPYLRQSERSCKSAARKKSNGSLAGLDQLDGSVAPEDRWVTTVLATKKVETRGVDQLPW